MQEFKDNLHTKSLNSTRKCEESYTNECEISNKCVWY